jgi:uncharacterized protein
MSPKPKTPRPAAPPWYAEGLRFACLRCGDCCRGEPGFVWIKPEEIEVAAKLLGLPVREFHQRYIRKAFGRLSLIELENGDCIMWSPKGCRMYAARPSQCRTFPFWREYVESPSAWEAAQKRCAGVGTGRLYSVAEIRARMKER